MADKANVAIEGKQGRLKIGWATRDISTDKPVNLPGQFAMRISKGISDPIFTTALVLDDGNDIVVFLSADLVVIRSGLLDEVRAAVKERLPDFPADRIIMNATHTHTGASHYKESSIFSWEFGSTTPGKEEIPDVGVEVASGDEYRHFLAQQAADAVCEAYGGRLEGGIGYGYGYAVVSHSRRVVYFDDLSKRGTGVSQVNGYMVDGHAKMYGNTKDDNFSHYEAGADHFLNVMYTFNVDGSLTGAIINVPCPSQNSEHEEMISADYWHDVREAIFARHGNIFILPQCAAAGDLSPRILHYQKAQQRRFVLKYGHIMPGLSLENTVRGLLERAARRDIAGRIAEAFDEVLGWAKSDIRTDVRIRHVVRTISLKKRRILDEELKFAEEGLKMLEDRQFKTEGLPPLRLISENSSLVSQRNRFRRIIERYKSQDSEPGLPMELHVVKVGDIAFASNRFELYMDYMHRIQARSPFEQTFVIQLAGVPGDDGGTYLATQRATEGKGYSACMFCNLVSPEGGQELVNETLISLNEIY
ncbi:MAG: hypothetical protein PHG48_02375 [Eubacteriales bacterium]|nr:hypothetical protein [Eubacteriales bacterium]